MCCPTTFNSLFEMRCSCDFPRLQIKIFLSILYLRCPIAKDDVKMCLKYDDTFNSLFEMHVYYKEGGRQDPQNVLSILYLRCTNAVSSPAPLRATAPSFNSLFEMPPPPAAWWAVLERYFQFSI